MKRILAQGSNSREYLLNRINQLAGAEEISSNLMEQVREDKNLAPIQREFALFNLKKGYDLIKRIKKKEEHELLLNRPAGKSIRSQTTRSSRRLLED